MAQRLGWRMVGATLQGLMIPKGEGIDKGDAVFNLDVTKMFPEFLKLGEVQRNIIEYGLKQKLADTCARPKAEKLTRKETIAQLEETRELLLSGQWNKKRTAKTPLEKAMDDLEKAKVELAEAQKVMTEQGVDKKTAESIVKKLYGTKMAELQKKVNELQKV